MQDAPIIRNVISVLLISIFAISITPKSTFHDLIATHNDECFDNHLFKGDQITKQGFSCHFENLVVESPYIWQSQPLEVSLLPLFNCYQSSFHINIFSQNPSYSELRGPPVVI